MKSPKPSAFAAAALACAVLAQPLTARLHDAFNSSTNWTLANNGGTATIGSSVLTLTAPSGALSTPTATLNTNQALTGSRQSILARSHTGAAAKTVFFLWAVDPGTGNKLELKINDQTSTTMTAGYWDGGGVTYHFVGSIAYSPGSEGLYMAFREAGGSTYWEVSTDGSNWTIVGGPVTNPVPTGGMTFSVQHKAYVATTSSTKTVVDCFNYKATGAGYSQLENKTYTYASQSDGWHLYTEAFCNACNYGVHYACQASDGSTTCNDQSTSFDSTKAFTNCVPHIFPNCVDSTQHAADNSWILLQLKTDRLNANGTKNATTGNWYMNMYRHQTLPFVDADVWTYSVYFKFDHLDTILQGLEFPINKYLANGNRLQGAVAWYPNRPDPTTPGSTGQTYTGTLKVWGGTSWVTVTKDGTDTGPAQTADLKSSASATSGTWYQLTFTVGLHDSNVYYTNFKLGPVGGTLTPYTWNKTYPVNTNTSATTARISPAFQIDNNTSDTTTTTKNVWIEAWNIDWADEKI